MSVVRIGAAESRRIRVPVEVGGPPTVEVPPHPEVLRLHRRLVLDLRALLEPGGDVRHCLVLTAVGVLQRSLVTGRAFRGTGQTRLALEAVTRGYESPLWLSPRVAASRGGRVRKGERATPIVVERVRLETDPATGEAVRVRRFGVGRVVNLEQCVGVEAPVVEPEVVLPDLDRREAADRVFADYIEASGVVLVADGNKAYYLPPSDRISLPAAKQFGTPGGYYGTAFHEAAHATGHESRLGRDLTGTFGSGKYALEEITAEVALAVVAAALDIEVGAIDNHAAYVGSWLKSTADDPIALAGAISAGWAAADLILALGAARGESR